VMEGQLLSLLLVGMWLMAAPHSTLQLLVSLLYATQLDYVFQVFPQLLLVVFRAKNSSLMCL